MRLGIAEAPRVAACAPLPLVGTARLGCSGRPLGGLCPSTLLTALLLSDRPAALRGLGAPQPTDALLTLTRSEGLARAVLFALLA